MLCSVIKFLFLIKTFKYKSLENSGDILIDNSGLCLTTFRTFWDQEQKASIFFQYNILITINYVERLVKTTFFKPRVSDYFSVCIFFLQIAFDREKAFNREKISTFNQKHFE